MKIKKLIRPIYYTLRYILHCIRVTAMVVGLFVLIYVLCLGVAR